MSFFEDDEEQQLEEVTEARSRTRSRGPSGQSPLVRVLLILVAVIVLVLITSLGIKSCLNKKKVNAYREYFDQVGAVVVESDAIGKELSDMMQKPDENVRQALEGKLAEFQQKQDQLVEQAKAIEPPDKFKQENEWFVASMQVRSRGLNGLQPAMLNAIEATDNQIGAAQVSHEMLIFLSSDVIYDEFFYRPCQEKLKGEDITDIKVPQSKFLADPALASQQSAVTILERLKGGTEQVSGLHGVAISSVKASPSGMTLSADGENSLKASDSLTFEVEIENQGEATENDVLVSLSLTSPGQPTPQKVDGYADTIAPGEFKTIELTGLAAEASNQPALLRVEVGPVPGEANTQNNTGEYRSEEHTSELQSQ